MDCVGCSGNVRPFLPVFTGLCGIGGNTKPHGPVRTYGERTDGGMGSERNEVVFLSVVPKYLGTETFSACRTETYVRTEKLLPYGPQRHSK